MLKNRTEEKMLGLIVHGENQYCLVKNLFQLCVCVCVHAYLGVHCSLEPLTAVV